MKVEVWLYGELSRYGENPQKGFASLNLELKEGITIAELLQTLKMPTEERGITFVNGNLSALPGLQPDLDQVLLDGDRISFFDHRSMWPFQYRHGAAMSEGLKGVLETDPEALMHHQQKEE
jgi:sulfur carrier protein ThiS